MSDVFTLSVRLEGAAFTDDRKAELSRVLRELATVVESFRLPHYGTELKVFDGNGNSCGTWQLTADPHELRSGLVAEQGAERGKALGSWVVDGNTTLATCATIVRGHDDGDPRTMDMCPAALSGEWEDGLTPANVLHGVGLHPNDDQADELLTVYEQAFEDAWWAEVLRACRCVLEDEAAEGRRAVTR
jgi:hypothetical protein